MEALLTENPLATFAVMSSVGFTSGQTKELEKLREAWKSLNDLLKNIQNAEACLHNHDLKLTADHLKIAKWNVGESEESYQSRWRV